MYNFKKYTFTIIKFIFLLNFITVYSYAAKVPDDSLDSKSTSLHKDSSNNKTLNSPNDKTVESKNQLIVYYFMSTYRCPSCIYIEKTTESIVNTVFGDKVKSGRIVFKSLNIDKPENKHFDKDYKLYAQSVVLSDVKDGKEIRWSNLDKVWKHLNNDKAFQNYVTKEIKLYLGE